MKAVDIPELVQLPWAHGAGPTYINSIPTPSQIGITTGLASLTDGFPPVTFLDEGAGGQPPFGADFNGILNLISANTRWNNAGGTALYDSTFSTYIGGYPKGAVLLSADMSGQWLSIVDDNATNPDTGGAGWVPLDFYGLYSLTSTGGTVTLTAPQYAKGIIIITGTLTSNLSIVFPKFAERWLIVNRAVMGSFTITATTSGGTPTPLNIGANPIYGDGTNVISAVSSNIIASGNMNTSGDTLIVVPPNALKRMRLTITNCVSPSNFNPFIQFNGDTAANYGWGRWIATFTTNGSRGAAVTSGINLYSGTEIALSGATNPLNCDILIANPNGGTSYKEATINPHWLNRVTDGQPELGQGEGIWRSTASIATISILLRATAGNSPAGSVINPTAGTWTLLAVE